MSDELTLKLDHITLSVADLAKAKAFYAAALAPLGMELVGELSKEQSGSVAFAGFGIGGKGQFWIGEKGRQTPETHICFRADSRQAVRAFHAAALAAGGSDNGAAGVRESYPQPYYAAFVLDPEGHNVEAVCRASEDQL